MENATQGAPSVQDAPRHSKNSAKPFQNPAKALPKPLQNATQNAPARSKNKISARIRFWTSFGTLLATSKYAQDLPKPTQNPFQSGEKTNPKTTHISATTFSRTFLVFEPKIHWFSDAFLMPFLIKLQKRDFVKI